MEEANKRAAEATMNTPPKEEPEKLFMMNGKRVPITQVRDELFQSAKTKRAVPIPMINGGFSYQK